MKHSYLLALLAGVAIGCAPSTPNSGGGSASDSTQDGAIVKNDEQPVSPGAVNEATPPGQPTDGGQPGGPQTAPQNPQQGGAPVAPGGGNPRQGGGGGGRRGGLAFLLRNEQIQTELKLTEDQIKKIEAATPEGLRDMEPEARDKAVAKMQEDIKAVLTPAQNRRVREISLQMQGPRALTQPDVAKELGLSAAQVAEIEKAIEIPRPEGGQGAPQPGGAGAQPGGGGFDREAFAKAREEANKKALAVLTADQKKKWEAMLGKKFELQMRQGGGGGNSTAIR